jgi:hypothetical protein
MNVCVSHLAQVRLAVGMQCSGTCGVSMINHRFTVALVRARILRPFAGLTALTLLASPAWSQRQTQQQI